MKIDRLIFTVYKQIEVSTVRLPLELGDTPDWETCVFYENGSYSEVYGQYRSEEDALQGHYDCLFMLKANKGQLVG